MNKKGFKSEFSFEIARLKIGHFKQNLFRIYAKSMKLVDVKLLEK
jgi:hypothetical protein